MSYHDESENKNFIPQIWTYPQKVSFEFDTNRVFALFLFFKNRAQTEHINSLYAWLGLYPEPCAGPVRVRAESSGLYGVRSRAQDLKPMKGRVARKFFLPSEVIGQ